MGGGYILIGVEEENGRPVLPLKGLNSDSIDGIQMDLMNKCNFIEPRYIPVIEPYTIDGKEILVLWITGGEDCPYKCPEKIYQEKSKEKNKEKSPKVYYIRKGARTLKANSSEETVSYLPAIRVRISGVSSSVKRIRCYAFLTGCSIMLPSL